MTTRNLAVFINAYAFHDNGKYYFERPSLSAFFISLEKYFNKVTIYQYFKSFINGNEVCVESASNSNVDIKLIRLNRRGIFKTSNFFPIVRQFYVFTKDIRNYDEIMCIGFSIFGAILTSLALFMRKNVMFYVRGDAPANNRIEYLKKNRNCFSYTIVRIFHRYNMFLIRKAKVVSVCGEILRKKYEGLNENVFSITPLLPEYYRLSETPSRGMRSSEHFSILYVGWLLKRKGIYELIDAAKLLKDNHLHFKVVIVGEGEEKKHLVEYINNIGLHGYVQILGALSNKGLIEIYDAADVFVLPSCTEGTPRVIAEAFARRLPVVASRVGSIPFMVKNGENGLLVSPGNPNEIFEALKYVIENPQKLERMGHCALQSIGSYMIKEQSDKFVEILRRIDDKEMKIHDV